MGESVGLAFGTVRANKLRSGLTVLGVVIGVGAIIGLVSLNHGFNAEVARHIEGLGSNVFYIQKFPGFRIARAPRTMRQRKDLTAEDAEALEKACRFLETATPKQLGFRRVRYREQLSKPLPVIGTDAGWIRTENAQLGSGRFLSLEDVRMRRSVCVLGSGVTELLFRQSTAVGREVSVGGYRFAVVGVLRPRGEILGQTLDDRILIPISTFRTLTGRRWGVNIKARARGAENLERAIDEARTVLRQRRKVAPNEPDDFEIVTQDSLLDLYTRASRTTFGAMVALAGISLVVGGIGIMNVMLASVVERTREIGIRKAVGATNTVVLWQFLVEAVVLTLSGGVVGMALGAALASLVAVVTPLSAAVPLWAFPLAFGFSSLIGIVSGVYPASRAARLPPVEALSYE